MIHDVYGKTIYAFFRQNLINKDILICKWDNMKLSLKEENYILLWIQYIWHTKALMASADVMNIQIPHQGIALAFINNILLSITREFQKPNFLCNML